MGKKPKLKIGIGESTPGIFAEKDASILEEKIRFSLRYCHSARKNCITKIKSAEIKRFYSTLGKFEDMKWSDVYKLPYDKGFNPEKRASKNHKTLKQQFNLFNSFFHFKVQGTLIRIFGTKYF
jgi:hypothetical protein